MAIKGPDSSFRDDSRGVSELIGFILMFAILIILLSINQAQFVPQENSEIEFQHFQEVRNDMVEVRSSISTAGQANVSQYPTVTLGTNYPVRLFAVNPPPPAGSLETSKEYHIWINDSDVASESVSTRFLVYRNGYNEMDIGPIWYEQSVLYLDERENNGKIAVFEDQNIITGNNSARVTALQNDFSVSSTGEVTVELYPTKTTTATLSEMNGNVTLKIPTRLNGSVYWNDALGDLNSNGEWEYHGTEPHPEEGIWWLNLTVNADSLKFNTVGINSAPEDSGSASQGVGPVPVGGTGEEGDVDTTPPTINSASATHVPNTFAVLDFDDDILFDLSATDASSIDRTILTATNANNGKEINQKIVTINPGTLSSEPLDLETDANFGGSNGVIVNITVVDSAGNSQTCTGKIDTSEGSISKSTGGLTC